MKVIARRQNPALVVGVVGDVAVVVAVETTTTTSRKISRP
jgi:hypothetical protein